MRPSAGRRRRSTLQSVPTSRISTRSTTSSSCFDGWSSSAREKARGSAPATSASRCPAREREDPDRATDGRRRSLAADTACACRVRVGAAPAGRRPDDRPPARPDCTGDRARGEAAAGVRADRRRRGGGLRRARDRRGPAGRDDDESPLGQDQSEIVFVVDVSRSMLAGAGPGEPTRLDRARSVVLRIRQATPDVPAGISGLTDRLLPFLFPTVDADVFSETLERSVAADAPRRRTSRPWRRASRRSVRSAATASSLRASTPTHACS